ncbi:urea ABC transporter permease subunit UrtB [Palleronia sp. KMU-117]|uniref:urea ABC transporter permease subunit UrtB n=1 Tax=Palleronia sp. KMU-117 TaxID=3434108 RepID=UPI003D74D4E3
MLRALLAAVTVWCLALSAPAGAQDTAPTPGLQAVLQTHQAEVASPSRSGVGVVLEALLASGLPAVPEFLDRWQNREVSVRTADGLFFYTEPGDGGARTLIDIDTGQPAGSAASTELSEIRPNGGVRREIAAALVRFQLSDPDPARRSAALDAILRSPSADQIEPLAASIEDDPDAAIRARKELIVTRLTARFGETLDDRIAAIEALGGDLSVDSRAVLAQILATTGPVAGPFDETANIARMLEPGTDDLSVAAAYDLLVADGRAPDIPDPGTLKSVLAANIVDGAVGGVPLAELSDEEARDRAYLALLASGAVSDPSGSGGGDGQALSQEDRVASEAFAILYAEPDRTITEAAQAALDGIEARLAVNQALDLSLDALSLASIYFLAAIGLAITFGVMGVINMAHGEFIMMGAYTGYVVQLFVPDYTLSILIALPLAFAVTFGAGVAMERLVIRWLYKRPLETLLATFGISIALQQLAKNIFGTQARPLTAPAWLDGQFVVNEVVAISYIRIAIFVLSLIFLALILYVLKRTRLGLEVRAVTQNPGMAASMGINPDRINMLTFGLGSGIAGIAGVAIGLYAQVTSEMGQAYIVQSFMTVVVGGVGNVWGTLAGATLIGFLQKGIEFFNPSNTLAAQTYMILFIILFIQFRPKGIVALRGRAAGD